MADIVEDLNYLHKEVYPDGVPDLIPGIAKVQDAIKFQKKDMLGSKYVQPVRLAYPGGFTHAKGDGTAGAFTLNDSKAGTQQKAEVTANQIVLRDQISFEDAGKAVKGPRSFANGTEFFYEGMQKAMRKRLEVMLLYGSSSIGTVQTYTSGDPSIVINVAYWAPGIWAGLEGTEIDIQSGSTSSVRGTVTISAVDIENRKITLSGTVTSCAAGDQVYFHGNYGNEMSGIHAIVTNTGTLHNINAATYSLWKASAQAVGSKAASFRMIKKATGLAVSKGLDEDVVLFMNPKTWDDVADDVNALRTVDKSEVKRIEMGAEEIVFHGQNGKITLISHSMVWESYAYGLCIPYWKRLGAVDVMFGAPGFNGAPFFQLQTKAGVEARNYTNQAIFCERPATGFYLSGITNTTT